MDVGRDRYRGALLGLATGDALGTTVEFAAPGTFEPLTDIVGGGPFGLAPGQWTDDTSMALCLAESIVSVGWDPADQMRRYCDWYRKGHLSSTGSLFDIGITTRSALERFLEDGEPLAGPTHPRTAGNGSIMRLAPVALRYVNEPELLGDRAAESSRTTHGAAVAVDACRFMASLLADALRGVPKRELLAASRYPAATVEVSAIAAGSFRAKSRPDLPASGYVVDTLEAALWALENSDDFRTGALLAVNLGNDADTTGAVYGQIAGAVYGVGGIPQKWRERITLAPTIIDLADRLFDLAHAT